MKKNKILILVSILAGLLTLLNSAALAQQSTQSVKSQPFTTRVGNPQGPSGGLSGGQPFTSLPGCTAAKNVVPALNEYDYPRTFSYAGGNWPMTCGPTSGAMILQSAGINSSIEKVTTDWERDGAWSSSQGFYGSAIAPALNKEYPGQIQARYSFVRSSDAVRALIQETGNAVMVSAYYNKSAVQGGLEKQQSAGVRGNTPGGISLVNNSVGHMVVVYQVCPDRVYINDPILAEQYSVPTNQFNTAISLSSRGEAVSVMSLAPTVPPPTTQLAKPTSGAISLCFGATESPYSSSNPHRGIDIANTTGTQVFASDGGTVAEATYDNFNGYHVRINHPNGLQTSYLHLAPNFVVSEGQTISRGQLIGYMDNSGLSFGTHLHFGVRQGSNFVDPTPFLGFTCQKGVQF